MQNAKTAVKPETVALTMTAVDALPSSYALISRMPKDPQEAKRLTSFCSANCCVIQNRFGPTLYRVRVGRSGPIKDMNRKTIEKMAG